MIQVMTKLKTGLLIALINMSPLVLAESQNIQVSQETQKAIVAPKKGESMSQVESNYGQPVQRSPAVGEPPITRWRYADFTVYFEYDKVIHSVIQRPSTN